MYLQPATANSKITPRLFHLKYTQVILFLLRNSEDKINRILLFEIKEPFLKNN